MRQLEKLVYLYLPVLLFFITPFIMSKYGENTLIVTDANFLPDFVSAFTDSLRWVILVVLLIFSILTFKQTFHSISKPVIFLFLFYIVQWHYALIDGYDEVRFGSLALMSLFLPLHLSISF